MTSNTLASDDALRPPDLGRGDAASGARRWARSRAAFWVLLLSIVLSGSLRSWITTRDDGLTIDEAWHAVAAASYVQTGDFRINPEHPPLMKLWVGMALGAEAFHLPAFRPMVDKEDERAFINQAFFLENDPDRAQARARLAMLAFHGVLLIALGLTLRATFGPAVALVGIALLMVDPTVAAHLPVVLTDLPLALTSALAVLLAARAFRSFRAVDLLLAALALGLAFAAKHSGLVTVAGVGGMGLSMALWGARTRGIRPALTRLTKVAGVLLGAYLVLWSLYGLRFAEGAHGETAQARGVAAPHAALFNRPLEDKIADLQSPRSRALLSLAVTTHALPRAYLWGLADIVRAGVEGRQETLYVYGQHYEGDTPWFFFPAVLTAKLPLGLLALALLGVALLARGSIPADVRLPLLVLLGWGALFLAILMRGNSGYAGIRHAAPVLPVIAVFAALPLAQPWKRAASRPRRQPPRWLGGVAVVALLALLASALPGMRPWEYYNELVGRASGAWRAFTDDGLDNGMRGKELAAYYHAHVANTGERAYDFYELCDEERRARGVTFHALEDEPEGATTLTGTMFVNARWLAHRERYDLHMFRDVAPDARFGNLLVFRGTFALPWLPSAQKRALVEPALAGDAAQRAHAEQLLREILADYPEDYRSSFELGNLLIERGARREAAAAYALSRAHAPRGNPLIAVLAEQIASLETGDRRVGPLRNPWLE